MESKELLFKVRAISGKIMNYEIIRNKYEFDETDNIKTPNTCWFILHPGKIDPKMNRYKINPGEIIKIGRITMRIRDIIFKNKKLNLQINESFGTNTNLKEMQTLKTDGGIYNETINNNENDQKKRKSKNFNTTERIFLKKKNQKEIFTKIEKKNKVCRICYMKEEEEDNPLVQPCICSGSMKFIHLSCLKQWISTRSCIKLDKTEDCAIFLIKPVECELCKTKYPDYIKHEGILLPLLDFGEEYESYLTLESLTLDKQKNKFIYVISLEKERKINVGRGHESNVILSDISVSRVHCYMVVENKKVFLEDNKSKFGTLILVQTPSLIISDNLPLHIQIGRTYLKCTIKRPFKLFCCCEAEEKNNVFFYYNQNEKYIHDHLGMVIKPEVNDIDDKEDDNELNNSYKQKHPLDIIKKYETNNSMKIDEGDKMSDNEYLLMKHNILKKNIKKAIIFNENIDEDKKKKKEEQKNNEENNNNNNRENEEEEEIEYDSANNNEDNDTASINNLDDNESISVSESSENRENQGNEISNIE